MLVLKSKIIINKGILLNAVFIIFSHLSFAVNAFNCDNDEYSVFSEFIEDSKSMNKSIVSAKKILDYFSYDEELFSRYKKYEERESMMSYHLIKYRITLIPFVSSVKSVKSWGVLEEDGEKKQIVYKVDMVDNFSGNYKWIKFIVLTFNKADLKILDIGFLREESKALKKVKVFFECKKKNIGDTHSNLKK
ncbi:hypothetical protein [Pseudoalteromonas luteoviolacea]|uniref:Uncharacterized protein n=1 Tax=Pseudoalteromonas luteoviolacea (strain 2ta16) TaxID=1353533 RepID=V4JJB3_PSEL2|nr:hypothetical protein [Pseudoalteromonas luteoviolacea]ESP94962.1 hypothetical protein PL2TA16_04518 [Pseudoalteromonas luteoviolacea 2ta16]KZN36292.1 hypothetical protein N483_22540 [Pseudoalteromonas luteoviolacea NCIMB 1944]